MARNQAEKCATKWCRNRRAEKITRYVSASGKIVVYTSHLPYCWKCKARRLKARHPATYVLNALRGRARQRKMPFSITLDQWKKFCAETGYLEKRGQKPESLTLDRMDWNEGYHIWNLRVLSHEENSAQGADNTPRVERGATEADEQPAPVQEPPPEDGNPF